MYMFYNCFQFTPKVACPLDTTELLNVQLCFTYAKTHIFIQFPTDISYFCILYIWLCYIMIIVFFSMFMLTVNSKLYKCWSE